MVLKSIQVPLRYSVLSDSAMCVRIHEYIILHIERYFCESRIYKKNTNKTMLRLPHRQAPIRNIESSYHIDRPVLTNICSILNAHRHATNGMNFRYSASNRKREDGGEEPWKIVARSSAFDESRVSSIDTRTRGTNGRIGRNLIKKKRKKSILQF